MGTPVLAYDAEPLVVVRPRIGPVLVQGGVGFAAIQLFAAGDGLLTWWRGGTPRPAFVELLYGSVWGFAEFVTKVGVVMTAAGLVPYLLDWGNEWRADAGGITVFRRDLARRRRLWTEVESVDVSRFRTTIIPRGGSSRTLNCTRLADGRRLRELWLSGTAAATGRPPADPAEIEPHSRRPHTPPP